MEDETAKLCENLEKNAQFDMYVLEFMPWIAKERGRLSLQQMKDANPFKRIKA